MMKVLRGMFCLCMVLAVWVGPIQAAEQEKKAPIADKKVPVIEVENATYEFDQVTQGETVKHDFRVFNRGEAPLKIKRVKPGWGCSVARFDRTIPPGGEGKITLEMRTKGYQGKMHKSARVVSNDPKRPQLTIAMKGKIWVPIDVKPRYVRLRGTVGEEIETVVNLKADKEDPLVMSLSSVSIPERVDVKLEETDKGRAYQLKVKNKVKGKVRYSGTLKLTTNYPEKPEIVIRIAGDIRGLVEVRPKALNFGRVSQKRFAQIKNQPRGMTRSISVILNKGTNLKIEKTELEKSLFKVSVKPVQSGRVVQILVEPDYDKVKKGANQDRLKIYTNQEADKTLEVGMRLDVL